MFIKYELHTISKRLYAPVAYNLSILKVNHSLKILIGIDFSSSSFILFDVPEDKIWTFIKAARLQKQDFMVAYDNEAFENIKTLSLSKCIIVDVDVLKA